MIELVDTHCHIQFPDYELDPELAVQDAAKDGVTQLICVGCTLQDSKLAVDFAKNHKNVYASIGLHPHESKEYVDNHHALQQFRDLAKNNLVRPSYSDEVQGDDEKQTESYKKYGEGASQLATQRFAESRNGATSLARGQVHAIRRVLVAIGETGLDYHYMHSPKLAQEKLLRFQIDLALEHDLPLIFHIREAYKDFWRIFDEYKGLRGVVHSFSSNTHDLDEILSRGLYVGLNGIITFTSSQEQLEAAIRAPLDRILLETDAPFLTPVPFRGTICQPKHVRATAEFLSKLRGESLETLASATTHNAQALLNLRGKT